MQFDVGNFFRAREAGQQQLARNVLAQHGPGAMQGNQASMNALMANPDTFGTAIGLQQEQESQRLSRDRLNLAVQKAREESARLVREMDDEKAARELAEDTQRVTALTQAHELGDRRMFEQVLGSDPDFAQSGVTFENYQDMRHVLNGSLEAGYAELEKKTNKPGPLSTPGKVQADIDAGFLPSGTALRGDPMQVVIPNAATPTPDGGLATDPSRSAMPKGVDFNEATGVSGAISNIANTLTDAVGAGLIDPGNERATQAMQNLSTNTMVTLAGGVAGRPSNFLLERFEQIASQPNSIWQGQGRTKEKLNQTRALIEQAILMNQDVLATSETAATRSEARANVARLSRLLSDYDVVIGSFGAREDDSETGQAPSWMLNTDPGTWSEQQKQEAERFWGISQ